MSNIPLFKFYKKNKINDSATKTLTSALTGSFSNLYDRRPASKLASISSNDTTPEIWEITPYDCICPIDTIFLQNHNIKSGNIEYWDGSSWVNFSTPATWSNNSSVNSLFTFSPVSTKKIKITMNTTMVANQQKYVGELYVLESIGTPSTQPSEFNISIIEKGEVQKTSTGGSRKVINGIKHRIKVSFSDASPSDIDLFLELFKLNDCFLFWPSGGLYDGEDYGLRIIDIYEMVMGLEFDPELKANMLKIGQKITMDLYET